MRVRVMEALLPARRRSRRVQAAAAGPAAALLPAVRPLCRRLAVKALGAAMTATLTAGLLLRWCPACRCSSSTRQLQPAVRRPWRTGAGQLKAARQQLCWGLTGTLTATLTCRMQPAAVAAGAGRQTHVLLLKKKRMLRMLTLMLTTAVRRMQELLQSRTLTRARHPGCSSATCSRRLLLPRQQRRAVVVAVLLPLLAVGCTVHVARCSTAPATKTSGPCTPQGTSTSSSTLSRRRQQQQQQVTRKQVTAAPRLRLMTLGGAAVPARPTQQPRAAPSALHLRWQQQQVGDAAWRLAAGAAGV